MTEHAVGCTTEELDIPSRDDLRIRGRLYLPMTLKDCEDRQEHALFVMLHGGGFCLGGLDTEEIPCQILCSELRVAVLNVGYRLAPEHPFPKGVQDCIDASIWVS